MSVMGFKKTFTIGVNVVSSITFLVWIFDNCLTFKANYFAILFSKRRYCGMRLGQKSIRKLTKPVLLTRLFIFCNTPLKYASVGPGRYRHLFATVMFFLATSVSMADAMRNFHT